MDFGATLCSRKPACSRCPLISHCQSFQAGNPADYPTPKKRKTIPVRKTRMLILQDQQQVLLLKRPASGIWGGLWSLPECPEKEDIQAWCHDSLGLTVADWSEQPPLRHTFSHFHLDITPILANVELSGDVAMEADARVWYNTAQPDALGLPAPVKTLLESIK